MEGPGAEHFIFIPGVLLIGLVLGYVMGSRSTRTALEKRKRRARE